MNREQMKRWLSRGKRLARLKSIYVEIINVIRWAYIRTVPKKPKKTVLNLCTHICP